MATEPPNPPNRLHYFRNWLSLSGLVIAVGSLFAFLLLFAIDLFAHHGNPYMGILAYVVAPAFLFLGLFLAGLGVWIQRRHLLKVSPQLVPHALTVDLSRPRDKKMLVAFIAGSVVFLLLTAIGSNRTYHYTESVTFCGQACHTPMKPEYTAYLNSPHARVDCTDCHVGPGASAFVKSKINGVHQLFCALRGNYQRPIPTPVKNLRPARETCEQCHWPQQFVGNLDRTYTHFLADETNTPFAVRLLLKVGGGDSDNNPTRGIHWHVSLAHKVEYIATDPQRQVIPWVRFTDANGKTTEYRTADFKDDPGKYAIRTMDCLDCHNRPAHRFHTPNDAVDHAMTSGRIDPALPWVKSNAVAVLIQNYSTESEAMEKIASALRARYSGAPQLALLVDEVQQIYRVNFFPEMRADWRAYPDNLNHKDSAGCFRCHDGLHKAADGKTKIQASDCNSCHTILAQGSGEQLEKLNSKGYSFFHIDAINEDFSCNNCHTGAFPKE
jgi:nitrate/TMAO reductase-like tetraheme cytochrome c subunit